MLTVFDPRVQRLFNAEWDDNYHRWSQAIRHKQPCPPEPSWGDLQTSVAEATDESLTQVIREPVGSFREEFASMAAQYPFDQVLPLPRAYE